VKKIHKILVPFPLSKDGIVALSYADYFHHVMGLDITVLHILSKSSKLSASSKEESEIQEHHSVLSGMRELVSEFYNGSIPEYVSLEIREGSIVDTIVDYSNDRNYDLIVIKKFKRKPELLGLFNQNDADKIIANAFCPVITISEEREQCGIKTIMLPIDITQKADKKINWTLFLAKRFNAKVIVVSALKAQISKRKSLARKKAIEIKDYFEYHGVDCRYEIVDAYDKDPHEAVLQYADNIQPDLIVVVTRKERFSLKRDIGTCATEIIHESKHPIFTFIPDSDTIFNYLVRMMNP
jgi:nucleotide-binding universal stress UspA family protein